MTEYAVTFSRSARKELESLDPPLLRRILEKIEILAREPRPRGSRKLRGENNLWRIRIGDHRVVYGVFDDEKRVDITAVRHRREVYD